MTNVGRIPALSIRQPWAQLIVSGIKDLEYRSWTTDYRGPIFIHAAGTVDPDAEDIALETLDMSAGRFRFLPRGAYIGMGMLDAVKRTPKAPDAYTFHLSHARRFTEPIVGRGHPGVYQVEEESWELLKKKAEMYVTQPLTGEQ